VIFSKKLHLLSLIFITLYTKNRLGVSQQQGDTNFTYEKIFIYAQIYNFFPKITLFVSINFDVLNNF